MLSGEKENQLSAYIQSISSYNFWGFSQCLNFFSESKPPPPPVRSI